MTETNQKQPKRWLVPFPEKKAVTGHPCQDACNGNPKMGQLLNYFLCEASWELERQQLPESCKVVKFTRSHDHILKKVNISEKTLVQFLKQFKAWDFVLSEQYSKTFTVQAEPIQKAMYNPVFTKQVRQKSCTSTSETSTTSASEESCKVYLLQDKVEAIDKLQLYNIALEARLEAVSQALKDESCKVVILEQKVEAGKLYNSMLSTWIEAVSQALKIPSPFIDLRDIDKEITIESNIVAAIADDNSLPLSLQPFSIFNSEDWETISSAMRLTEPYSDSHSLSPSDTTINHVVPDSQRAIRIMQEDEFDLEATQRRLPVVRPGKDTHEHGHADSASNRAPVRELGADHRAVGSHSGDWGRDSGSDTQQSQITQGGFDDNHPHRDMHDRAPGSSGSTHQSAGADAQPGLTHTSSFPPTVELLRQGVVTLPESAPVMRSGGQAPMKDTGDLASPFAGASVSDAPVSVPSRVSPTRDTGASPPQEDRTPTNEHKAIIRPDHNRVEEPPAPSKQFVNVTQIGEEKPVKGKRGSLTPKAPKKSELDELTKGRIEAVYATLNAWMQKITGDPDACYAPTKRGDEAILAMLVCKPTPQRLTAVCDDMWNEKNRDGEYWWRGRGRMSVPAICGQYPSRGLSIVGTQKPASTNGTTQSSIPGYTDYTHAEPVAFHPLKRKEVRK